MTDPWTFGWPQLLTLLGFGLTATIAVAGFRTFDRWKREKLEEKRIEVAIEAMAYAYEAKWIFKGIRSAMTYQSEWKDLPERFGTTDQKRNQHGPFYAILKRVEHNSDYFKRGWTLLPRCKALFGERAEQLIILLMEARREVEVSAEMLMEDPSPQTKVQENNELWAQMKADVWGAYGKLAKEGDRVGKKLAEFEAGMEALCRPIIDRGYEVPKTPKSEAS